MKRTHLFLMSALILPLASLQAEPSAEKDSSAFNLFTFDEEESAKDLTISPAEEKEETLVFDDLFDEPSVQAKEVIVTSPEEAVEESVFDDMFAESAEENNAPSIAQVEPSEAITDAADPLFTSSEPVKAAETMLFEVQNTENLVKEIELETPILIDAKIVPRKAEPLPMIDAPKLTKTKLIKASPTIEISLKQVFAGSPIIYTVLLAMSVMSLFISLYNVLSLRSSGILPETLIKTLRHKLMSNQFDEALVLCLEKNDNFFCKMLASGISTRKHGLPVILETMKAEGKRATTAFWQRMALLNDIAIIAPMIGLLGTVLGMFYAFYDLNRSIESISTLFDGLGISVGTTVAGLVVAVLAMIFQSMTKYRLVRQLAIVENEAQAFATLLDSNTTVYPR